ncbi:MAG TPA: hypothetical protein VG269_11795 [Tepidisphaeraceae bacterium]|nr:hypothetical protein [Tepidisphaeraceae bacterium]
MDRAVLDGQLDGPAHVAGGDGGLHGGDHAVAAVADSIETRFSADSDRTTSISFWQWRRMTSEPVTAPATITSLSALHWMNSEMSGWSTSITTIFAARRVGDYPAAPAGTSTSTNV